MKSISIESAEASFLKWREQRSNRAELIPEHLWNMAVGLYPQYKRYSRQTTGLRHHGILALHQTIFTRKIALLAQVLR